MSKNDYYNNSYNNFNLNNEPTENTNSMTYVLVRPFYRWYYDNWYPYFWGSGGGGGYYNNYSNHHHRRDRPFRHRHKRNHRYNDDNRSYGGKKVNSIRHKVSNITHKVSNIPRKVSNMSRKVLKKIHNAPRNIHKLMNNKIKK